METEGYPAMQTPGIISRLGPSLGTALLISMGYIDPGKWAAAIEGGAHFGVDLMLLVLIFNWAAILCQSLAARIGVVTGKNLAQICCEEYTRPVCIFLGVQTEISVIALDLTMILGIAHGLNLLLGLDLYICVLFAAIDAVIFPLLITFSDKWRLTMPSIGIAGFLLLFYVLGVLTGQPDIPVVMNVMVPRVRRESLYTLLSLLGANILPHNFYIHSSIVQQQQRFTSVSISALCHDHFFAITFVFSLICLVNYVVMNSAITVFHSAGLAVLSFQDALLLMDQIFRSPMAPLAFFLLLFFSSQLTALACNVGGRVLLCAFFGIDSPVWLHYATTKAVAIIPALYCVWNSGAEGIYQLLIFSQVILALHLPSAVIPLFRVASSSTIMGSLKISWFVELLALSAFFGIVALNILFIVEILFGDSEWISNLKYMGGSVPLPYIVVLVHACASIAMMLWLAATPLKSASHSPDVQEQVCDPQGALSKSSEDKELVTGVCNIKYNGNEQPVSEQPALEKALESKLDGSTLEQPVLVESMEDTDESRSSVFTKNIAIFSSALPDLAESPSFVEPIPVKATDVLSASESPDANSAQKAELKVAVAESVEVESIVDTEKDDDEVDIWEPEESSGGISGPALMYEGPGSYRSLSGKSEEGGSGSGSLSRLSGLGRAARRQLAVILDEFWGQLYDFHGQLTREAKAKRMDLLGVELKPIGSSLRVDPTGMDSAGKYFQEVERGSNFLTSSRDFDFSQHQRKPISLDSSSKLPIGSLSWTSRMQPLDTNAQAYGRNPVDTSERRYSSLHLPPYSDSRDYQPATVHGYQFSSYLNRIPISKSVGPTNLPMDQQGPESTSFATSYPDPLNYTSGQSFIGGSLRTANMQNLTLSRLQMERTCNDSSSLTSNESVGSLAKKYHSLPDITGLGVSNFISSSGDRNSQWSNTVAPGSSTGKTGYGQSLYSNVGLGAERVPLAFDELSPSKLHRDAFSLQSSSNLATNSLWHTQPFEQLFGKVGKARYGEEGLVTWPRIALPGTVSHTDSEAELLQALRFCIVRLLKLEGSDWLFRQNGGPDEELIDRVAARERFVYEAEAREFSRVHVGEALYLGADQKFGSGPRNEEAGLAKFLASSVPHCGEGCIWRVGLIVSFGVWCIQRILELSLMESRPELWGKYTYVLNRLQGILDPAFSRPRSPYSPCSCLQISTMWTRTTRNGLSPGAGKSSRVRCTSPSTLLDMIKDVEIAVSCRKGRTGTAAGDVAFPKGKENLASVLKRYKRRLSNKPTGTYDSGSGSRRNPGGPSPSFLS